MATGMPVTSANLSLAQALAMIASAFHSTSGQSGTSITNGPVTVVNSPSNSPTSSGQSNSGASEGTRPSLSR